jgi:hypothetical protein
MLSPTDEPKYDAQDVSKLLSHSTQYKKNHECCFIARYIMAYYIQIINKDARLGDARSISNHGLRDGLNCINQDDK